MRLQRIQYVLVAAVVLIAFAIAWLSLAPANGLASGPGNDKIGHLIAYGALATFAVASSQARHHLIVSIICMLYGGVIEVLQELMPFGREASFLDLLANAGGVLAGYGIGAAVLKLLTRRYGKA